LTFCGCDSYGNEGKPVTIDTTMTEADFSGKGLGAAGAQILAAFMGRKFFQDKGSLSKLDLSGNNEYGHQSPDFISPIASALKTNTSITELSLSGNKLDAEAAEILSEAIQDSRSLASLDISDNNMGDAQQAKIKQICAGKSIKFTL
jgi:hypothetical protein